MVNFIFKKKNYSAKDCQHFSISHLSKPRPMPQLSCSSQPSAFPTCKIKRLIVISHPYLKKKSFRDLTWRAPWPLELVHLFVVDTSPLCKDSRRELWISARREHRFRLDRPSAGPAQTLILYCFMPLLYVGQHLWLQTGWHAQVLKHKYNTTC